MSNEQTFFLISSEGYGLEDPKKCQVIKQLSYNDRDDFVLVKIDPPILYRDKMVGDIGLSEVVLASRHVGYSILDIQQWPLYVYVLKLNTNIPLQDTNLNENDFQNIAWAELYPTEKSAKLKKL